MQRAVIVIAQMNYILDSIKSREECKNRSLLCPNENWVRIYSDDVAVVVVIVVDSLQYGLTVISLYAFALTDIYDAQRYILFNWFRAAFFPLPFRIFP